MTKTNEGLAKVLREHRRCREQPQLGGGFAYECVCGEVVASNSHHVMSAHQAKKALEYLAVAQPVVNTVEELDALPFNTVAMFTMLPLDRPVPFELSSINGTDKTWQQPGDSAAYPNSIMARYLPAIVLHRPEVKS